MWLFKSFLQYKVVGGNGLQFKLRSVFKKKKNSVCLIKHNIEEDDLKISPNFFGMFGNAPRKGLLIIDNEDKILIIYHNKFKIFIYIVVN